MCVYPIRNVVASIHIHRDTHTHSHVSHIFLVQCNVKRCSNLCKFHWNCYFEFMHTHTRTERKERKRARWRDQQPQKWKETPFHMSTPSPYLRDAHYKYLVSAYVRWLCVCVCVKYDRTQFHIHKIKWFEAHLAFIYTWYSIQIYMLYQYKYLLVWWG